MKRCIDGYVYDTDFSKLVVAAPEERWGGEFNEYRSQKILYKAPNSNFFIVTRCLSRGMFPWGRWETEDEALSLVSVDEAAAFVEKHGTGLDYCSFVTFYNVGNKKDMNETVRVDNNSLYELISGLIVCGFRGSSQSVAKEHIEKYLSTLDDGSGENNEI